VRPASDAEAQHERAIAGLLSYGTVLASAVIAAGLVWQFFSPGQRSVPFGWSSYALLKAGVALFILLPVARVVLMLTIFLSQRDYVYAAISSLVLAIIATGVAVAL
jgi:uncharacterized membrane protein